MSNIDNEFEEELKKQIAKRVSEAVTSLKKANQLIADNSTILAADALSGLYYGDNSNEEINKIISQLMAQIDDSGWRSSSLSC